MNRFQVVGETLRMDAKIGIEIEQTFPFFILVKTVACTAVATADCNGTQAVNHHLYQLKNYAEHWTV